MRLHNLGIFLFLLLFAAKASATIVSVQPDVTVSNVGDLFNVNIFIDQVADMYAWQLDVNFDPTVLQAVTVNEGGFLATGGSTFFVPGTIDNAGGAITFNADSLETAIAGVTGSGNILSVEFQMIAQRETSINLANVLVYDSQINQINTDTANGTVMPGSPVPEPREAIVCFLVLAGAIWTARRRKQTVSAVGLVLALAGVNLKATDIPTAQIDAARTMANGSEIYLTTHNVNSSTFGKLFSRTVDGAIFGQPLYLQGMTVAAKKVNIVYVATSHNNVYAFDADSPTASTPIWTANLGPYDTPSSWNNGLGVLSTPLIVRSSNTMYVTAATSVNGSRVQSLHALDLSTGAEKFSGPVVVSGSVTGTTSDAQSGVITFDPTMHIQRTGLALAGNNVVLAYSADRDFPPYHGWIFTYSAGTVLQQTGIYNDARGSLIYSGYGAGIWQSGRAPAVDSSGAMYFETGNGNYDGVVDFGESFIKLTAGGSGLGITDWFTPNAWQAFNQVDYDLSSSGPSLVPNTNLLFGGAKNGVIYVMSTANMGHVSNGDANLVQSFTATTGCAIPFIFQGCSQIMGHVFWPTAPVPTLFVWGVHDVLRAFQFSGGKFNTTPVGTGTISANYPGGVMSMSSYLGTSGTGILWAITDVAPDDGYYFGPGFVGTATLHAFDANNVGTELWNSSQNLTRDGVGTFASFAPPLAVNGKVYVPTFSNQLVVYGLINGPVPGDVNGDSVVSCPDLAIVKASFGKTSSQPGFDLRADVNGDGIVNVVDLSTVSRALPLGTVCQ